MASSMEMEEGLFGMEKWFNSEHVEFEILRYPIDKIKLTVRLARLGLREKKIVFTW